MLGMNNPDRRPNNLNIKLVAAALVHDGGVQVFNTVAVSCCLTFEQDPVSPARPMARQVSDTSDEKITLSPHTAIPQ